MALDALATQKLRSSLTLLGVTVGVFSIIVVMTAMRVLQQNIESEVRQFGGQTFMVQKWPAMHFGGPEGFEKYWRRKNITFADTEKVRERATLAANVGVETHFWSGEISSRYETTPPNVAVMGVSPGSFPSRNWIVGEGRAILESDLDAARDVCVLGHALALSLFPHASPLGERVGINGIPYTVIGVLEPKGSLHGGGGDREVLIPITAGMNRYGRRSQNVSLFVQAKDAASYVNTLEQVRGILRAIRKVGPGEEDDFEMFSADTVMQQFNEVTAAVRYGVAGVSSIALLAAGIGIMNIMLVSVTERTREIGIRRAIGARKRSILLQFMMEAVVLCQVGGIAGMLLGILGGNVVALWLKVPPAIPFDWVVIGLIVCSGVGIVFGTYPAIKAARLDPIEALRHE
jgi:putative ABC transport system permease protein